MIFNGKSNTNLPFFRLPGNKNKKPGMKLGVKSGKIRKFSPTKKNGPPSFIDARSKIIQNNRRNIKDAREKIVINARKTIVDARDKLTKRREVPGRRQPGIGRELTARMQGKAKKGPLNQLNRKPLTREIQQDSEDEDDYDMELDSVNIKPMSLKRTVHNDSYRAAPPKSMPKMPTFNINNDIEDRLSPSFDPFDCYVVPTRVPVTVHHAPRVEPRIDRYPTSRVMSAHMDTDSYGQRKGILRKEDHDDRYNDRFDDRDRYADNDRYADDIRRSAHSSSAQSMDSIRSRLYNEPRDRNESMGIFAKMPVARAPSPPMISKPIGHRIIVSNLHHSVSDKDVRELFEDVGKLVSSNLVRAGVAEVVFKELRHADEAVETYHNRQLDGRPMKCMLVPTRNSAPSYGDRM